jgi:AraC-like DNA-binding protein
VSADQIADAAMAVAANALRTLCGSEWSPTEVLVPRMTPADPEPYRRHFRAPVRFNRESATLVFPADDLKRRVAGADPLLRAVLEDRLRQLRADAGAGFSDDVRRLLRTRLMGARSSAEGMAHLLAIHRRTLSRRLRDSGRGYRAMANEVRFEIARQLLEDTEISLGEIAAALGYSEASAFTRAFRRWSGQSPKAWRWVDPRSASTVPDGRVHAQGLRIEHGGLGSRGYALMVADRRREAPAAFDLLEVYLRQVAPDLKPWFKNASDLDSIRSHPRYAKLLELAG